MPREAFPRMVSGLKEPGRRGTKFATHTIIGQNAPLVLAVEPVKDASHWESEDTTRTPKGEVVDRLLERALEHVDIQLVMADREFATYDVQHAINEYDVTYLIPKPKYKAELTAITDVQTHAVADVAVEPDVPLYPAVGEFSHHVQFMYVPSRSHVGEYAVFMTNRPNVSPDDVQALCARYSRRWDIENEYKIIKRFLPGMASTNYRVRFFNFVFACSLYNVWRLTDALLKTQQGIEIRKKPLLRAGETIELIANYHHNPG